MVAINDKSHSLGVPSGKPTTMMKRLDVLSLLLFPGLALAQSLADYGVKTSTADDLKMQLLVYGLLYIVPTVIAFWRNTNMVLLVFLTNVFLGWTGIGWIVALVMALKGEANTWRPKKLKARRRR